MSILDNQEYNFGSKRFIALVNIFNEMSYELKSLPIIKIFLTTCEGNLKHLDKNI